MCVVVEVPAKGSYGLDGGGSCNTVVWEDSVWVTVSGLTRNGSVGSIGVESPWRGGQGRGSVIWEGDSTR